MRYRIDFLQETTAAPQSNAVPRSLAPMVPATTLPVLHFAENDYAEIARVGRALRAQASVSPSLFKEFFAGRSVLRKDLAEAIGPQAIDSLTRFGVLEIANEECRSRFGAKVVCGKVVFTDLPTRDALHQDLFIDPLWEGHKLAHLLVRTPAAHGLDVGCGCGVLAIVMSDFCESVTGVDVNPRALAVARFNAYLNEAHNVTFLLSNLFDAVSDRKFDRIVFSAPVGEELAGHSLLEAGEDILAAFFREAPSRLSLEGVAQVNLCFRDWQDSSFFSRFETWLGENGRDFQYVFLQRWRRTGIWQRSGGPRILWRYLRRCVQGRANPLRSKAISRGFLTLRRGAEGSSWLIPSEYHLWRLDSMDGSAGQFLIAAMSDLVATAAGRADASGPRLPGEEVLEKASGQDLRARTELIRRAPATRARTDHASSAHRWIDETSTRGEDIAGQLNQQSR